MANAALNVNGQVSGFGSVPNFNELNYSIKTDNASAFINKLELKAPDIDFEKLSRLNAQGVLSGDMRHFALNLQSNLNELSVDYQGDVAEENEQLQLNGDLLVKHPDFGKNAILYINGHEGTFKDEKSDSSITLEEKIKWLFDNGYEVSNHTSGHLNIKKPINQKVQKQIAIENK